MADPVFPEINIPGQGRLYARLKTTQGVIVVELEEKRAPKTVANFVGLSTGTMSWKDPLTNKSSNEALYDGVHFHRVIPRFMVQVGCPNTRYTELRDRWGRGSPGYNFANEIHPDLRHDRPGVLSMANAGPNTNSSQFFITEVPTPHLDGKHTVFGFVVAGQDVVNKIAHTPTRNDRPIEDQKIEHIEIFRSETKPTQ